MGRVHWLVDFALVSKVPVVKLWAPIDERGEERYYSGMPPLKTSIPSLFSLFREEFFRTGCVSCVGE